MTRREFLKLIGIGALTLGIGNFLSAKRLKAENLIMNETAARIYKGYKEGRNAEQIASDLTAEYDVDFGTALKDTKEFLTLLRSMGY
ncbi:MAG: PqqD family peptide modification chaperone [candidate division WOR-3 bacterium]